MGNALDRLLVEQIASAAELKQCDDLIPIRYNGRPGEPIDATHLFAKGRDYRWFGKRRIQTANGEKWEVYPAHPVLIRPDGRAVVANCKENVALLDSFQPQRHMIRVDTPSGHKIVPTGTPHPPLYERLKSGFGGVSLDGLSESDRDDIAKRMLAMMDKATAPAPTVVDETKPAGENEGALVTARNKVEALRTELEAATFIKDDESVSPQARKEARDSISKLEKSLDKATAELKALGG